MVTRPSLMKLHTSGEMSRNAWLTPDVIPTTRLCRRVFIPNCEEMIAAFKGALQLLAMAGNWEQHGDATPDDCAYAWLEVNRLTNVNLECSLGGYPLHVGQVFLYPSETAPSGCLLCNGGLHNVADYPLLFGVLDYDWGGSGASFAVPDLRSAFFRGAGNGVALGYPPTTERIEITSNTNDALIAGLAVMIQAE